MGRVTKLLKFARRTLRGVQVSESTIDPGGGPLVTATHWQSPGDDSHPLASDYVFAVDGTQAGKAAALGYIDPVLTPKTAPGEKRIYARDEAGAEVAEIWLKSDGTITLVNDAASVTLAPSGAILGQNGAGAFELQPSGTFDINGVTIDAAGAMVVPASLTLAGKELAGHTHPITSGSSAPGPTGPNN